MPHIGLGFGVVPSTILALFCVPAQGKGVRDTVFGCALTNDEADQIRCQGHITANP